MVRRRSRVRGVRRRRRSMRGRGIKDFLKRHWGKFKGKVREGIGLAKQHVKDTAKSYVPQIKNLAQKAYYDAVAPIADKVGLGRRRMKGGRRRHRKGMRSLRGRRRIPGSYPAGSGLDYRY